MANTPKAVMDKINKDYPGALRLASDEFFIVVRVPTGVLAFDRLTGGGIAIGAFTEIYGEYSSLKSFLAIQAAVKFQKLFPDKRVMWVDAEGSFDGDWVSRAGVDMDMMDVIERPETGEAATEIMEIAMKSRGYCLFVVDSIAAMIPKRETEYDASEGVKAVGAAGRMNSATMRRLTRLNQNDCAFILINQVRDAIGVTFGDPSRPTGGRAIPFYAGQRIELRRGENIREEVTRIGTSGKNQKRKIIKSRVVNMTMRKDKTAPREGATGLMLWTPDKGEIDEQESLLILGMEDGIVTRAAASITIFPNSKKDKLSVRGWEEAKKQLKKNPKLSKRLRRKINERSEELGHLEIADE